MRKNPFRSKSQARLFFAKEARGDLAPGTAERWMDETPDFDSLPEYVGENPDEDEPLVIQLFYFDGPQYWNRGRLAEVRNFWEANQQLDLWGNQGRATFTVYILDELVYQGSYDLSMKPADLRRQMVLYLEQLDTEDSERLLGLLVQQNPEDDERGYIDPDTGAWMSRRLFEEGYYEHGDAVVSETITEDQPTVEAINEALLAGTVGIGTSGLVTTVTEEQIRGPEPEPARIPHTAGRRAVWPPVDPAQEIGLSDERLREISEGHGLAHGGYEWENVRDEWIVQLSRGDRTNILEIEAETFGSEVMGSSRDFFGLDIYSLNSPVILFDLGVYGVAWPEQLIGADETWKRLKHGQLTEYEKEDDVFGDEDGMITHEGGDWALYAIEETEEEDEDEEAEQADSLLQAAERVLTEMRELLGDDQDWDQYSAGRHQANDDRRHLSDERLLREVESIQETSHPSFIRGYAEVILGMERAEPDEGPTPERLEAGTEAPGVDELTERFGRARPLPWNPAINGWFLGGSRWIQYRRQQADGRPRYSVVNWDGGVEVGTLFTGRVDEVIHWLQQNLLEEIGAERTRGHGYQVTHPMARGVRRISNTVEEGRSYIVDGELDHDGFAQWVADAVGFFNERGARAQTDDFPTDPTEKVQYLSITSAVPSGEVIYRLHGPWRIEERSAVFKHRMASSGFINRFRLFSAGEADRGQRVQLFHDSGQPGSIRDIVITTWLAGETLSLGHRHGNHAGEDHVIVGFRLINGDNGIEIMNGQVNVQASHRMGWNKGYSTVRKILDLIGVRAVFLNNGWPEEYYLNIGYADNPFVYF